MPVGRVGSEQKVNNESEMRKKKKAKKEAAAAAAAARLAATQQVAKYNAVDVWPAAIVRASCLPRRCCRCRPWLTLTDTHYSEFNKQFTLNVLRLMASSAQKQSPHTDATNSGAFADLKWLKNS